MKGGILEELGLVAGVVDFIAGVVFLEGGCVVVVLFSLLGAG